MSLSKIDILGKVYTLKHIENTEGLDAPCGQVFHTPQTVYLYGQQGFEQKRDTLLHEVLHALDYAMQLSLEEHQVHAVAAGLLCTLRANPEFVEYLCEPRE